jgi:hypothetical protein
MASNGDKTNPGTHTSKDKNMAQDPKQQNQNQNKAAPAAQTAKPANGAPAAKQAEAPKGDATAAKPKKVKKPRVRFVSTKEPSYEVKTWASAAEKFGAPKDPWGNEMVMKASVPFGGPRLDPDAKKAREAEKAATKAAHEAKKAAMSDAEKLAYAKERREAKQKTKADAEAAKYAAIKAQVMADIAAGKV